MTTNGPAPKRSVSRAGGPVTEQERARMVELAEQGWSVRAIAKETGRSPASVSRNTGDVTADRREQTANATQARSVQYAETRTKLKEQTAQAAQHGLARWANVAHGDHRGSSDEAKSFANLVTALGRLDDLDNRSTSTRGLSDVDAWLDAMTSGEGTP